MAGCRREQGPISCAKLRPRALAAQHSNLVAQDQQLEVLGVQATTTPNECAQQGPECDVEKGEGHSRRSSQPAGEDRDRSIGALQAFYASARGLQDGEAISVIVITSTAAKVAGITGGWWSSQSRWPASRWRWSSRFSPSL
jgi:hypothetical protein